LIVPFPHFEPDKSRFNGGASNVITNCKPTADGWGPLPSLTALSGALASAPLGAIAVKNDAGTVKIYVGTATKLYEISTNDYTFTDRSKVGDYNLAEGERWEFDLFGETLIATALGDVPQFIDIGSGTIFADLTNATFQARHVAVVGDFVVFGYTSTDARKLVWSGLNDATFWTIGERGSDEQILPDGGVIQGIIPQQPNALVAQDNKWRGLLFDSTSDYTFHIPVVNPDRGVYAPRSIVNIGPGDFVYLSKDGFFRGLQARPIGAERVDRWFFDTVDTANMDLTRGVADPYEKIVWWRFVDDSSTNHLLGYDWQLDRWCYSDSDTTELLEAMTAGFTVDNVAAFGNVDTIAAGPDSRSWIGGVPGFAGFDSTYKFGFFDGTNQAATIETEDKQLNYPRRAITSRHAALVDNDNFTIAVASKESPKGALSFGSDTSPETNTPWVSERNSGRYHRFRVKIPAAETWKNAVGIDVDFVDGGMW
jgi:hypothetical protein